MTVHIMVVAVAGFGTLLAAVVTGVYLSLSAARRPRVPSRVSRFLFS